MLFRTPPPPTSGHWEPPVLPIQPGHVVVFDNSAYHIGEPYQPPSVGSLFSGIGGLDLGLERAGFQVKWQVEIDSFCRKVLAKHWPDVPRYGDIYEVDFTKLEPVDVLCGGFPCQPFSCAGKQQGMSDERYLWPEFARAIGEVGPRVVLLENVPGILSVDSGRAFGQVLGDLASLGFDAEWDCIPAAAVGAPHLRYRVFLVAYTNRLRQQQQKGCQQNKRGWACNSSKAMAFPNSQSLFGPPVLWEECPAWDPEPPLGRVVNGIPHKLVAPHLQSLGNAIVPQVAEWIGRRLFSILTQPPNTSRPATAQPQPQGQGREAYHDNQPAQGLDTGQSGPITRNGRRVRL